MNETITGIPSGDGECWCLEVTEEEYRRVKGDFWWQRHKDRRGREMQSGRSLTPWRLYPNDFIKAGHAKGPVQITVSIMAAEMRQ